MARLESLTREQREAFHSGMMQGRSSTFPVSLRFWTWREAIEVATRVESDRRVSLSRDGDQWEVRYYAPIFVVNAS